jgi:hypothetical protein
MARGGRPQGGETRQPDLGRAGWRAVAAESPFRRRRSMAGEGRRVVLPLPLDVMAVSHDPPLVHRHH